jgi:hypothetical protein
MKTKVTFLYEADSNNVFAFFPNTICIVTGFYDCYSHFGQHSQCSIEYVSQCREAHHKDYAPLYKELRDLIGYDLEVQNKNQIKKKANHMIELYSYFK